MPMILMMCSMADSPPMVWNQNGGVCDVTNEVVQLSAVAKTLMATAGTSTFVKMLKTILQLHETTIMTLHR